MGLRAQAINTLFFRGNKCLNTYRSLRTMALSILSSAAIIWRLMSVSVRNPERILGGFEHGHPRYEHGCDIRMRYVQNCRSGCVYVSSFLTHK